jgi:hypothetical protein
MFQFGLAKLCAGAHTESVNFEEIASRALGNFENQNKVLRVFHKLLVITAL